MPTITIGDNSGNTYTGAITVDMGWSAVATTNYNELSIWPASSGSTRNSWIKFSAGSIANIPSGSTINTATLTLYTAGTPSTTNSTTVTAYRCTRDIVNGQVDWTNYSTGNAWATLGGIGTGDRAASSIADITVNTTTGASNTLSGLAALVQIWLDTPANNQGVQLTAGTLNGTMAFSIPSAADGVRPVLTIDYTAASGSKKLLTLGVG